MIVQDTGSLKVLRNTLSIYCIFRKEIQEIKKKIESD